MPAPELWDVTPGQPKIGFKPGKKPTEFYVLDFEPEQGPLPAPVLFSPDGKFMAFQGNYIKDDAGGGVLQKTKDPLKLCRIRELASGEEFDMDAMHEKWLRAAFPPMTWADLRKLDKTASLPALSADRSVVAALGETPRNRPIALFAREVTSHVDARWRQPGRTWRNAEGPRGGRMRGRRRVRAGGSQTRTQRNENK